MNYNLIELYTQLTHLKLQRQLISNALKDIFGYNIEKVHEALDFADDVIDKVYEKIAIAEAEEDGS